ncbi:MAG TPA: DUF973 family protein [Thermoplasmata archaeon]|nr:DUF973 family protein [Thermoplasmata archaeon]
MAGPRCPKCGAFGAPGATFCAFCGAPLPAGAGGPLSAGAPPSGFGPPPPGAGGWYSAPGVTGGGPGASPASRAAERTALTYVLWAAVVLLVGGVLSVLADLTTTATGTAVHFGTTFLAVSLATGACEFVAVALFYFALRNLAPQDSRFSTPSKLVLALLIAILIVLAALVPFLSAVNTLESCISSSGMNQTAEVSCISGGDLAAVLSVVVIAGIVALVGFIGLLLGIWRLGTRYQNSNFKVGAILLIIPFLNIVGAVLILVAARSAQAKLGPAVPV